MQAIASETVMCSKQVLQSIFRSKLVSELPFSWRRGCAYATSTAHVFNTDQHKHTHAYPLRLSHVKTFQAWRCCTLARCVCMSTGVLRCGTIIPPHAVDADSDSKYAKHCLSYESPTNQGFFRIFNKPCVHFPYPYVQKYLPMYVTHHNAKHERSRNLTTQALEDGLECVAQTPKTHTSDLNQSQAVAERMHVVENGIMLRQADLMLEADNEKIAEELDKDDILEESTDDEKEFYDLIEAEDSPDELLSMLLNLEATFPSSDPRVCRTCLRLAKLCNDTNGNPEKILDYARKAFHNFDSSKFPLESARSLFLVGIAHYKMGELKQAVASLERCVLMMEKLGVLSNNQQELATLQYSVKTVLGQAKISIGWSHEGLLDFEKGLTVMEKSFSPESPRLAACYRQTAEVYLQASKPMEALSLCKKALSISLKCYGPSSSEVAELRSFLVQIYYELNDYENALCECQLAGPVLEKLGKVDEAISLYLESMQAFFCLGKLHDAVTKLKEIITNTEEESPLHVEALILLVRALNGLKDDIAAREYCQKALNILEMKDLTFESAKTLVRLSVAYGQLKSYDQALAVAKQALQFFEHCTEKEAAAVAADTEGYTGFLLLSIGRPTEAIVHLERSITKKKSLYGSESAEVLNVCNHLGVAYAHAAKMDEALAVFRAAKMVLNQSNDTAGLMSIYIHNNLSVTCSLSGSIDEAIKYKRHAIDLMRKASKEYSFSLVEAEEELKALVQAQHGKAACESKNEVLRKMLTSYTQARAIN